MSLKWFVCGCVLSGSVCEGSSSVVKLLGVRVQSGLCCQLIDGTVLWQILVLEGAMPGGVPQLAVVRRTNASIALLYVEWFACRSALIDIVCWNAKSATLV